MPHDSLVLSQSRRRLVSTIQNIRFGAIENLVITNGEPVLSPDTYMIRDKKFGKSDTHAGFDARESPFGKDHFSQLFGEFSRINNGVISLLEIQNGLPFRIRTKEHMAD